MWSHKIIMATDYSRRRPSAAGRFPPDALSDLSLRQLLSFRAVADEGSFHGAADALDYTQSAVSQHVMALEAALGVRLFDRSRGRRTVELTEAGAPAPAARRDDHRPPPGRAGRPARLRGGRDRHAPGRRLPERRARGSCRRSSGASAQAWPNVEVRLPEAAATRACWSSSSPGALDLVVRRPADPRRAVRGRRAPARTRSCSSRPRARPLPARSGRRRSSYRRPAADRVPSCRSTRWVEEHLRAPRRESPNFVFRSEDNGTVQAMAGAGLGTALVPLLAVDTADPSVVVIPTDLPPRRVALIWHRDRYRSPASPRSSRSRREVAATLQAELEDRSARARRLTARIAVRTPGSGRSPLVYSAGARQPVVSRSDHARNPPRIPDRRRRRRHRRRGSHDDPGPDREGVPDDRAAAARVRALGRPAA